jgi:hypothetical protein
MNSTNTKLLILFLALFVIFNATNAMTAENDSKEEPNKEKTFECYTWFGDVKCVCLRGEGTCADMLEICEDNESECDSDECSCDADEDKFRETGSQFDELKSKIDPQSPAVENAPTTPIVHDHRSPKIDSNSNTQAEIVAPNNRTGTVRVQRTRPSSSPTENAPTPIVTDHR